MRIVHVSPHLPPDQAANALLPAELGSWQRARGDRVRFVAHVPTQTTAGPPDDPRVLRIPIRRKSGLKRQLRLDVLRVMRAVGRSLKVLRPDLIHLHSNGLIIEAAARYARLRRVPYVLTLYGTEIWHYRRRWPVDPFRGAYRRAAFVTFYSKALQAKAAALGLKQKCVTTIYPPVDPAFGPLDEQSRSELRQELGILEPELILNVKRLHPLAGQSVLIDAFARLARGGRQVRLVICGTGPLEQALKSQAQAAGVADRVTFTGLLPNAEVARYAAAASVFALPSKLEAMPTVALEALTCGAPVVSGDHPGGLELRELFGPDVTVVPREDSVALAHALEIVLAEHRRTSAATEELIENRFRPGAVLRAYDEVYASALGRHP